MADFYFICSRNFGPLTFIENVFFITNLINNSLFIRTIDIQYIKDILIPMKISFRDYLASLHNKNPDDTNYFVLGNASVDYDSFFGSILLAYLLTNLHNGKRFYLPLISCQKEDIQLRFEIEQILKRHNISKNYFHYIENLTEKRLKQGTFVLVDHNQRHGISVNHIQYIIDHHVMNHKNGQKSISHLLGSNLTNIFNLFYPSRFKKISKQIKDLKQKQEEINQDPFKSQRSYIKKFQQFIHNTPFDFSEQEETNDYQVQELLKYGILIDGGGFKKKEYLDKWSLIDQKTIQLISKQKSMLQYEDLKNIKDSPEKYKKLTFKQTQNKDRKIQTFNGKNGPLNIYFAMIMLSPQQFMKMHHEVMKKQFSLDDQKQEICLLMAKFEKGKEVLLRFRKDVDETFKQSFLGLLTNVNNADSIYYERKQDLYNWIWLKDPSKSISRKKLLGLLSNSIDKL